MGLKIVYCLSMIIVVVSLFHHNFKKLRLVLDFRLFFTAGYMYYLFIPFGLACVYPGKLMKTHFRGGMDYLEGVTEEKKLIALISIDLLYFCMIVFSGLHMKKAKNKPLIKRVSISTYQVTFFAAVMLFVFAVYLGRSLIGHGYAGEFQGGVRGPLTFAAHITVISLLMYLEKKGKLKKVAFFLVLIIQALVISTGTRMEGITTLIGVSLAILSLKGINSIKVSKMVPFVALVAVFMTYVGIARSGYTINGGSIVMVLFGEAIASDYSLFSSLSMNSSLPLVSNPLKIFVLLINLVPTVIYPNKWEVYYDLIYNGSVMFQNPAGAMSLHTSVMVFFGILGIPIFCLLLSIMLKYIRRMSEFVYYDSIGVCTFLLFRNGFETTMIKNLFECCVLFPFAVLCFGYFVGKEKCGESFFIRPLEKGNT